MNLVHLQDSSMTLQVVFISTIIVATMYLNIITI